MNFEKNTNRIFVWAATHNYYVDHSDLLLYISYDYIFDLLFIVRSHFWLFERTLLKPFSECSRRHNCNSSLLFFVIVSHTPMIRLPVKRSANNYMQATQKKNTHPAHVCLTKNSHCFKLNFCLTFDRRPSAPHLWSRDRAQRRNRSNTSIYASHIRAVCVFVLANEIFNL